MHRLLRPRLRRPVDVELLYKYASHKLLRWLSGYLLAAAGVLCLGGLAALGAWILLGIAVLGGAGLLAVGLVRPSSLPGKMLDMAAAFAATSLGVLRSLRGDRFQVWTPPASARSLG